MVEIYTDGASLGNPGKGAYAIFIIYDGKEIILSKGFRKTTNNRMEIMAISEALNFLKDNKINESIIFTDSQLVAKAINEGWLQKWNQNGWKTTNKSSVLNVDLWKKVNHFLNFVKTRVIWVESHSGNKYNDFVDKLAKTKAKSDAIEIDYEYEYPTKGNKLEL